ncbi:MAG: antitoxin VapB family protein [Candidatus Hodarchaeales archaeon]
MASKTIMIQEETYIKLANLKRKNESFNDVIERLLRKEQNLNPFFGLFTEKEGKLLEKSIEEVMRENEVADLKRIE